MNSKLIRLGRGLLGVLATVVLLTAYSRSGPVSQNSSTVVAQPTAPNATTQHIAEPGKLYFLWITSGTRELTYDCNVKEVRGKWVRGECKRLQSSGSPQQPKLYDGLWLNMDYVVAALPHQANITTP
jgi:hypothetical protein